MNNLALTVKQEKFCVEYAKLGNARQAYKNAGYQCKNESSYDSSASQLLRNPKVQERLAELAEEAKNNAIADIREMQEMLSQMLRGEIEEEIVVVVAQGDGFSKPKKINKQIGIADRIKAIDKLARMTGAYNDKLEVSGTAVVQFAGEDSLED